MDASPESSSEAMAPIAGMRNSPVGKQIFSLALKIRPSFAILAPQVKARCPIPVGSFDDETIKQCQ
jgi:hypothetical protein